MDYVLSNSRPRKNTGFPRCMISKMTRLSTLYFSSLITELLPSFIHFFIKLSPKFEHRFCSMNGNQEGRQNGHLSVCTCGHFSSDFFEITHLNYFHQTLALSRIWICPTNNIQDGLAVPDVCRFALVDTLSYLIYDTDTVIPLSVPTCDRNNKIQCEFYTKLFVFSHK